MSRDEKIEVAKGLKSERLLELFFSYRMELEDVYDTDHAETFDIIKAEILSRMDKET